MVQLLRERMRMRAATGSGPDFGLQAPWLRRALGELALLALAGMFLGAIGPFDTDTAPAAIRFPYWLGCIVGGGAIGIAIDAGAGAAIGNRWARLLAVSLAMTPFVTLLVMALGIALLGNNRWDWGLYAQLLWQVLVIALPVMTVRMIAWHRAPPVIETRTLVAPPLPEAEAMFRRQLSVRRRGARLIAVEAHDHYLRVHTDAGAELVTMRFADALDELAGAHGMRVHRSWWVAAEAVESARWRRGSGEVRLAGGLSAPVSRTYAPLLREAGWFR